MKKLSKIILALSLVCAMVLSFAACSNEKKDDASTTSPAETTAPVSTDAAAPSDEEDGQNPIMNYVGRYDNGGCHILVEADGDNGAKISIEWPMTDDEKETYTMSGDFDFDTFTVHYDNSTKTVYTLDAEGNVTDEEIKYTDGSGKIVFHDDGTLDWLDENEAERIIDSQTFTYVIE